MLQIKIIIALFSFGLVVGIYNLFTNTEIPIYAHLLMIILQAGIVYYLYKRKNWVRNLIMYSSLLISVLLSFALGFIVYLKVDSMDSEFFQTVVMSLPAVVINAWIYFTLRDPDIRALFIPAARWRDIK